MDALPRLLCTVSSLSIVFWVYAVNRGITVATFICWIASFFPEYSIDASSLYSNCWLGRAVSYPLYFLIIWGFAYWTTTFFDKVKSKRELGAEKIKSISIAGEDMAFTYFGLFFYALSVNGYITLLLTFTLLCMGLFYASRLVFNPLYLFCGYRFYKVETDSKTIMVISDKKYQFDDDVSFRKLALITPFTFVELKDQE